MSHVNMTKTPTDHLAHFWAGLFCVGSWRPRLLLGFSP
jgi:hypothetical protein